MDSIRLSYREVIPDQTLPEKWKDFTLNTGGTQSTLQDIKVPQRAGGYSYKDPTKPYTRNRFIYWRLYDDVLELVEHSLDVNLIGNQVRYHFQDSPVLEGLSIHETSKSVVVLVCTVSSVHRLTFPLPDRIHRQEFILNQHPESSVQSVFAEASLAAARDPASFHVINSSAANTLMPHCSASWLTPSQEALFALAYTNGTILLARHSAHHGTVATLELKQESLTSRLFGFAGALRGRSNEENVVASMILHSFGSDTFLFCLGRSGQLRIWSCSRGQCVMVSDVIDDAADQGKSMTQGAQSHVLRRCVGDGGNDTELLLGVFLCFSAECQFAVLHITYISGNFRPNRLFTIHAPSGQDLVDFALCRTQLWAVWRNTQGETAVSSVLISSSNMSTSGHDGDAQWKPAVLEPGPEREYVVADAMTDPRQAYVSYIFHPGRFSLPVIIKALSIFRRSPGVSLINEVATSAGILKEHVCQAVESEIQNEVSDYELIDEEYLEVANRCWAKFYSCCVQYHITGSRPIGLVLLVPSGCTPNSDIVSTSGVALVNKAYVSLLRPMDSLETLVCGDLGNSSQRMFLNLDPNVESDLLNLIQAVNLLEQNLSEETKTGIENELYRLQSPETVVQKLVSDLLQHDSMDEEFDSTLKNEIERLLKHIVNIPRSFTVLLSALDIPQSDFHVDLQSSSSDLARHLLQVNQLFSSQMGISTIAEATRQFAVMRFSLCRNLLLLQQLLLDLGEELCSAQVAHTLRTELTPRTVTLTQAYYVMVWICRTPATPVIKPIVVENTMQRMAILKLSDSSGTAAATASALGSVRAHQRSYSLLELFLQTTATRQVHRLLAGTRITTDMLPHWSGSMLQFVAILSQLIWPITNNFIFPEFLLSSCQHLLVQEYVRLLNKWCESNICSRKFLLGTALLDMGEPHKALDLLIEASEGLNSEEFLVSKIVPVSEECTKDRIRMVYFLKVIQLFEQQNCPDCVIQLAETASEIADKDDPDLATLYSVAFVSHLRLEHHQEAYHSLNSNPDAARRVDCLRQLVVTLLELKRLDLLLEFPYESLVFDLERIVESRARSLDVSNPIFYNFLYAFHIKKGNFRKAASIMYEQGMRLGQEGTHSAEFTERQAKCFLACLNALQVVDPKFAWIVKPSLAVATTEEEEDLIPGISPKRNFDGEEFNQLKWKREVEVLEIVDIRKEYDIVQCRLRLIRHSPDKYKRTGCRLAPSELVAVLSQVGMYQAAVKLCRSHKLPFQPVLESLSSACVRLTNVESCTKDPNALWEWLSENDLSELGVGEGNPVTIAWRLLEVMVMNCEEDRQTVLHKAVSSRLLALGVFLPNWLVISYKERNASELLRLMLGSGRLSEASSLAVEYIQAALGHGKERFGLQTALHVTSPAVCLPIPTFKLLLLELEEAALEDTDYKELRCDLTKIFNKYMETVEHVSRGMEKAAMVCH